MASSDEPKRARAGSKLYGGMPEPGPPGFSARLLDLADALRNEGMAVGTSELLDAFDALRHVTWTEQEDFKAALSATIAKSQEDRRVFDLVFDRFFFRAVEKEAVERGLTDQRYEGGERLDMDELRDRIREVVRQGSDGEMRDSARLAIAAFERHLRRELERGLIERTQALPPAKPLSEFDRALPSGPLQDLAAVHRTVQLLKRRLATQGHETRGRKRGQVVDVRRTMRASLETGGVPVALRYRPKRPRRPELYVLCDVSTSVTSASVFFLSVLHALHDAFRKLRLFVFVERISEVTEIFERERSFKEISHAIATEPGVADVSGYTDYGRVWLEFHEQIVDDLDPRSTVIVLGDARTNGREPQARAFGRVSEHAGRTFWLNPEPRLYWNYGDSVMRAYEPFCDGVFECWTTKQLEQFVNALTDPHAVPPTGR